MIEIPAGVTRYPRSTRGIHRNLRGDLWIPAWAGVAAIVAIPLLTKVDPLLSVGFAGVGLLLPPASVVLPWWLRCLFVAVSVIGLAVSTDWSNEPSMACFGSFASGIVTGVVVLGWLLQRRAWRRRMASAEGAPPADLDPRGGSDVGILATWSDEAYDYEAVDPNIDVVLGAIRALDGATRSVVSIYRGRGRLDVGGDAGSAMIVQQSDNRRRWNQVVNSMLPPLSSKEDARKASKTRITYAGQSMELPDQRLTDLASAEIAARTWLLNGERDKSLSWWEGTLRHGPGRPPALKEIDVPGSAGEGRDMSHMLG